MDTNNTYYDNDEKTRLEGSVNTSANDDNGEDTAYVTTTGSDNDLWRSVFVGGVAGLVFGVGVSSLTAAAPHAAANVDETGTDADETSVNIHNAIVDSDISFATSVNDDMSFSQAFATARTEVGAGGVFEWHGNLYGTFTADEWNGMSADDKHEYNSHFAWNNAAADNGANANMASASSHGGDRTVLTGEGSGPEAEIVGEPEVQVLGVIHDDEYNVNLAGISIDDQDVLLADIDNDGTFDVAASDLDHNGQLTYGEVIDISDAGITTGDLGGFTDGNGDMLADGSEGPDYVNDGFNDFI